jgi:hypothetical protein
MEDSGSDTRFNRLSWRKFEKRAKSFFEQELELELELELTLLSLCA